MHDATCLQYTFTKPDCPAINLVKSSMGIKHVPFAGLDSHLQDQVLKFSRITHHASVTQCLGSIGRDNAWYLGVAKPSIVAPNLEHKGDNVLKSRSWQFFVPPAVDSVQVFKITGPKFLKLHWGTWHAGPLFKPHAMDF
ncbi:hypothetical protein L1987_36026 [Smallanthus sonchifolius]|uniref:Uncharacterized protein n=1 Tax=Smallanthus sonchifolius TaxID=185202 RepID=A0ACB9HER5_9ASTR|nr:hypothetical protein L1987_36026 [Smallanthus sonchifolius]